MPLAEVQLVRGAVPVGRWRSRRWQAFLLINIKRGNDVVAYSD